MVRACKNTQQVKVLTQKYINVPCLDHNFTHSEIGLYNFYVYYDNLSQIYNETFFYRPKIQVTFLLLGELLYRQIYEVNIECNMLSCGLFLSPS